MSRLVIFAEEGIVLLNNYKSYKSTLEIKCSKRHITKTSVNKATLRKSRGTYICTDCENEVKSNKVKEKVKTILQEKNYSLASDKVNYINKFDYVCNKGHKNSMHVSNLMNGKGCPDCYGNRKIMYDEIKEILKKENYIVVGKPTGAKVKFIAKCPLGHEFKTSYDRFVNNNSRCPSCATKTSNQEEEVFEFISNLYDGKIIRNDRSIIGPKELDIVIPKLKLAIEYCGLYWHSELQGKDRTYHVGKLNTCIEKGYKLITIFEDEWTLQNEKCKSRLASYVNSKGMRRVFARKCKVREIDGTTAKVFCEANHIQNYGSGSSIKLGLFLEDELVSCLTFSKPSLAKGRKGSDGLEYELHRFVSLLNTVVLGGASKLFKHFERNYKCDKLFTFADRRWSTANLYYQLGFELVHLTSPCYFYFKDNCVRQHRFVYRKNVLKDKLDKFDPEKTEVQNMYDNGYNRIWDTGNYKLVKEYK